LEYLEKVVEHTEYFNNNVQEVVQRYTALEETQRDNARRRDELLETVARRQQELKRLEVEEKEKIIEANNRLMQLRSEANQRGIAVHEIERTVEKKIQQDRTTRATCARILLALGNLYKRVYNISLIREFRANAGANLDVSVEKDRDLMLQTITNYITDLMSAPAEISKAQAAGSTAK